MPEVLHPFAVVEVAVSGAVEPAVLHGDDLHGAERLAQTAPGAERAVEVHGVAHGGRVGELGRLHYFQGAFVQVDLLGHRLLNSSLHQGAYTRRPAPSVKWYEQNGMARPSGTVTIMEHSRSRRRSIVLASM